MKKLIEKLLCDHSYHLKGSYQFYDGEAKTKEVYVCFKCGKTKTKVKAVNYIMNKVRV